MNLVFLRSLVASSAFAIAFPAVGCKTTDGLVQPPAPIGQGAGPSSQSRVGEQAWQPGDPLDMFGPAGRDIVATAERVEAYRVEARPFDAPPEREGAQKIVYYPVVGHADDLGPALRARAAQAALSKDTYYYGTILPSCMFEPGIAFRFVKGTAWVDVLVCFKCEEIMVQTNHGEPRTFAFAARARLVQLAKASFPHDAVIQALSDRVIRPTG